MELMKKRKRLTEVEARYFMHQIFSAIQYLHKNHIIHRDLKLGNLFLSEKMEIKTGDFGLATVVTFDGERKRTICGTPNYLAPEILKNLGHSYEVDIWSCGVILYTMLVGTPPFETSDVKTTYKRIKSNLYKFPSSIAMSDTAKNFIKKMLNPEPSKRPTVREALLDDFFTSREFCIQLPTVCPDTLMEMIPEMCSNSTLRRRQNPTPVVPDIVTAKKLDLVTPRAPLRSLNQNTIGNRPQTAAATDYKYDHAPSVKVSLRPTMPMSARPSTKSTTPVSSRGKFKVYEDPETPSSKLSSAKKVAFSGRKKSTTPSPPSIKKDDLIYEHHYLPIQLDNNQRNEMSESTEIQPDVHHQNNNDNNKDKMEETCDNEELTKMHDKIEESFANAESGAKLSPIVPDMSTNTSGADHNENRFVLRVSSWQDFSTDYGLAYRLSNGLTGAYFNDHTKIVFNHQKGNVDYVIARKDREGYFDEVIGFPHIELNYPRDLTKKMLLIKYFKHCLDKKGGESSIQYNHLTDVSNNNHVTASNYYDGAYGSDKPYNYVYVKRWQKTNNSIVFRLTDRTVQVCFFDKTEIILGNEARYVTYIDKQGQMHTRSLEDPELHKWPEVTKRLQYTKDIIYQMIPSNNNQ
jgi:polo-like kinase 1